ncbi:NAD-dependent epimerase/dehydratase family protein [Georgenia subflava]|uniref:NAD-dependent epimerase/dehydratase family protein n=1 Tax=Georgenia subflava TaxID=1622177 RepID=A0A6N7EG16_9MICO|nr:NAD-dependent epimerase/dehydratase family protein [Georgenia subflava]MPV36341.1 NAD-dependent epimerase/dehydratase family protein [Georgenia subflava]
MAQSVLFIGGSGVISAACTRLAVESGLDVTVLNRGRSTLRPPPPEVREVHADVRDTAAVRNVLGAAEHDVVVDFVAFTAEHARADVELFAGRTGQYVFISSASAYEKPPRHVPIVESTPLHNPYWQYARDKIAAEHVLMREHGEAGFPVTVVRPSHTYDATKVPIFGGWTAVERMRRGQPVVVPGEGTTLWTLTHSSDFAVGLVGLLGRHEAIGEAFTITGDETLSWNEIFETLAAAAGAEPDLVHVPGPAIAALDAELGASQLGDKLHPGVFDTSKLRALVPGFAPRVPFADGAREMVAWHDADPARRAVDPRIDGILDTLVAAHGPR